MRWITFTGILLIAIGCGVENTSNGGGGSTTTTFVIGSSAWKIEAGSGQGDAIILQAGEFSNDSANAVDLVLMASSGAYFYKSLQPTANGFENLGRIDITAATYLFGIGLDIDLDANSTTDLLLYRQSPAQFEIALNNADNSFSLEESSGFTTNTNWMAWAPFKNRSAANNKLHALAVSGAGGAHRLIRIEDSSFSSTDAQNVGATVSSAIQALSGDFNADGFIDFVIIPASGSTAPRFLVNDADDDFNETNGTFVRPGTSTIRFALTADFDLDGNLDLLFATTNGFELYINETENGDIVFQESTQASFGSTNLTDVVWMQYGDLTEDDNLDLIVAREGNEPVLFGGQGELQWADISTQAFGSQLNSTFGSNSGDTITQVYIIDLDDDGVNDLVMLNDDGDITPFFNNADDSD